MEAAANILRADKRYASVTGDLLVRGIQTEGRGRNRFLHLWFYRENRKDHGGQACITVLRCFRRVSESVLELRESFSSRATMWLMVEGAREK